MATLLPAYRRQSLRFEKLIADVSPRGEKRYKCGGGQISIFHAALNRVVLSYSIPQLVSKLTESVPVLPTARNWYRRSQYLPCFSNQFRGELPHSWYRDLSIPTPSYVNLSRVVLPFIGYYTGGGYVMIFFQRYTYSTLTSFERL